MKSLLILVFVLIGTKALAQAEFLGSDNFSMDSTDAVIEEQAFSNIDLEDPVFPPQKGERDIASFTEDTPSAPSEWQGHLEVLKEIPYSDPWLSHASIQQRTLDDYYEEE